MSRRFGRNQRRRMREQVAQLQTGMEMDRALLRHQSRKLSDLTEQIDRAKRMVGANSALFEPKTMLFCGPARGAVRGHVVRELSPELMAMDAPAFEMATRDIPLDVMLASIKRDEWEGAQHVRIEFGDGRWGYAISRLAMERMPQRDLALLMARELAPVIAQAMKSGPR